MFSDHNRIKLYINGTKKTEKSPKHLEIEQNNYNSFIREEILRKNFNIFNKMKMVVFWTCVLMLFSIWILDATFTHAFNFEGFPRMFGIKRLKSFLTKDQLMLFWELFKSCFVISHWQIQQLNCLNHREKVFSTLKKGNYLKMTRIYLLAIRTTR